MTEHTDPSERETSATALQERMNLVEVRVAALTEALQVLARGLEASHRRTGRKARRRGR